MGMTKDADGMKRVNLKWSREFATGQLREMKNSAEKSLTSE